MLCTCASVIGSMGNTVCAERLALCTPRVNVKLTLHREETPALAEISDRLTCYGLRVKSGAVCYVLRKQLRQCPGLPAQMGGLVEREGVENALG
jgi:hypothetical protein